ncbi:MAG: hypothetical protein KDA81_00945 [Planctomycetaceae bacterium]|nr:hypothetical protein [Planctomycetaceae bacterium]
MWFEQLTGFQESTGEQVRENLNLDGSLLTSRVNGRTMVCGTLEVLSLADLRRACTDLPRGGSRLTLSEVVADVQRLHVSPANSGALFQVASQFNLLEMVSPSRTPDDGIDCYEYDRTQGPACAIACGAGTIFRNYFVNVDGRPGQTALRQLDCLRELGILLGNTDSRLWAMKNGYALATADGLRQISERLGNAGEAERDSLRERLAIGIHWNTQVTLEDAAHLVTQAYCSALPVAYSRLPSSDWEPFARLILEAAYEATFCAGICNAALTGNRTVYLTLLGGGAFGNSEVWIADAIRRSVSLFANSDLQVAIVSYGRSQPFVRDLIEDCERFLS